MDQWVGTGNALNILPNILVIHIYICMYICVCANFSYLPSTLHRQCEYKQYKEEEAAEKTGWKKYNEKSKAHFQLINEIN